MLLFSCLYWNALFPTATLLGIYVAWISNVSSFKLFLPPGPCQIQIQPPIILSATCWKIVPSEFYCVTVLQTQTILVYLPQNCSRWISLCILVPTQPPNHFECKVCEFHCTIDLFWYQYHNPQPFWVQPDAKSCPCLSLLCSGTFPKLTLNT